MSAIAVFLLGCLCCAAVWESARRRDQRLRGALEEATAGRHSLQRVARLAGRDLRETALRLTGEAAVLTSAAVDTAGSEIGVSARLAVVAARCRSLADDLGEAGLPLVAAACVRTGSISLSVAAMR